MEEKKVSNDRIKILKFKLESLLDITLSINANLPTEVLLSQYESILRKNLGIGKILIFKHSATWECLLNGGFPKQMEMLDVESRLLAFDDITYVSADMGFEGVDIIVPVLNNHEPIAFLFIGDIEEEGEGMSPVLKHLTFIQTISSIIIVAIENIRLHKESLRQEAMKKELELASRMQKMLIPDNRHMPKNPDCIVNGFYFPHYEVGGDYYDCLKLSDTKTGFCIADVSGKGISAAILMSNFQASLRALLTADIDLEQLIHKLNSIVVANAAGEKFITFFVGRYDHREKVLSSRTVWICASCYTCSVRCPNKIDIARIMDTLRNMAIRSGVQPGEKDIPLFHSVFLDTIKSRGRIHELSLILQLKSKTRDFFKDAGLGWKMFRKGKIKLIPSRFGAGKSVKEIFKRS